MGTALLVTVPSVPGERFLEQAGCEAKQVEKTLLQVGLRCRSLTQCSSLDLEAITAAEAFNVLHVACHAAAWSRGTT